MKKLLLTLVFFLALPCVGLAANCDAVKNQDDLTTPQLHETEANPLQYQFDSGATWTLCWHVDPDAGLVLSRVFYGAPAEPARQVLDAASIGQILFKYDEDTQESQLLSEYGLGRPDTLLPDTNQCESSQLLAGFDGKQICQRVHYLNPLTKVRRSESKPRYEMTLHAWSRIGTHQFQQLWRFSEDGEIRPTVTFSGHIGQYTNDAKFGVSVNDSSLYASSATLLVNWRLDFNLNGTPDNDQVDEFEFPLSDSSEPTRSRKTLNLDSESMRTVESERFRGWRISDIVQSVNASGVVSGNVGYYLDPQSTGHRFVSRNHEWTQYDFMVTNRHACEKLSSSNNLIRPDCPENPNIFAGNEPLDDAVIWYSVSRHFTPNREDHPAISATELSFALIPFDWSSHSTFSPESVIIDERANR